MIEARVDELAETVRDGATEQTLRLSGWNIHGPSGWYPSVRDDDHSEGASPTVRATTHAAADGPGLRLVPPHLARWLAS
jgi:hypothetical protein